ncbi:MULTISPECIES: aminomethyl-transferring glycine dehydrogenase subunit GcvPA [unclassified Halanaerobium]|jgi:glycine dehydrogenase subunit 1|uniref:aminomethyl-transferring glycine dehydrogenase subunit GcvPA n=1 Tax=unclassified Halanaerobium TaxID=2641197 RepID=UPI000E12139B|nr:MULTISPECIES: aminomethyl-transferring glycine dehydrogenase subunit GcvPA [unclassified Halanaerobium]RCW40522.1 glycine dehydrogenase (decarboxylating) alpha subunit [Halanaerobium sp. MA284_MarDTE_T2]RCW78296.1 glycine dehydrogenase (decarboxylating) alpha subunit [Halanaerobium sp. DL-01]
MDYVSNTKSERKNMLKEIGVKAVEDLFNMIPEEVALDRPLNIPDGISELELVRKVQKHAAKNKSLDKLTSFLGAGAYDHYVPGIIDHLISRSEFYTAYTPYQAELSQGTLEAIYEYQSMISELTGLDVTNASMLDGGSAAAEAVVMGARISRRKKVLLPETVNPAYREVIRTYGRHQDLEFIDIKTENTAVLPELIEKELDDDTAVVVVQYPNFFGSIEKMEEIGRMVNNAKKAVFVVIANPILLGLLKEPAEFGADIVVGEAQNLGNGLNYGGPYLGFMSTRDDRSYIRQLPGRIVGKTTDVDGKEGFVLTLQTREQHIRRERATSNICTNEALNALMATIYMAAMGKDGLKEVAEQSFHKAHYLAERIDKLDGYQVVNKDNFFFEFVVKSDRDLEKVKNSLLEENIIVGYDLKEAERDGLLICVTEKRTKEEMDQLVEKLEVV